MSRGRRNFFWRRLIAAWSPAATSLLPWDEILYLSKSRVGLAMQIRQERQLHPVADEVLALTAVVRPILKGLLYALKDDVAQKAAGREKISLALLARLYRAGDGDCGICFEYAVHEAMNRRDPRVLERINDAIKLCRINGSDPQSILFGLEKSGSLQLIDSVSEMLTEDSRILAGTVGQPPKLLKHFADSTTQRIIE
jgi:hypothetical protein